jgi:hypothetical protein
MAPAACNEGGQIDEFGAGMVGVLRCRSVDRGKEIKRTTFVGTEPRWTRRRGIDVDGVKHPLSLVEGLTENPRWSPS